MSRFEIEALYTRQLGPVDLAIEGGECVCLSGGSGAGKSLLLRALADLDPHTGHVRLDGEDAEHMAPSAWRRQVGLLPAESHWWRDTVAEHFVAVLEPESLGQLGFPAEVGTYNVTRMSTGERQRLALLRLLANHPKVLLLDEPTASLDVDNVARVEALVCRYREQTGAAVLWVSHDPRQIARVAQRHFHIEDGRLVERELAAEAPARRVEA